VDRGNERILSQLSFRVAYGGLTRNGKELDYMAIRIQAITKPAGDDRYEAISHYWAENSNGVLEGYEREWFISYLEKNKTYSYVSEDNDKAVCDVKENDRIRFLQTRADASEANNLLSLPRK